MSRPVSSMASRRQAWATVSPSSTKPPGSAQPCGSWRRSIRTIRSPISMIASTVGVGFLNSPTPREYHPSESIHPVRQLLLELSGELLVAVDQVLLLVLVGGQVVDLEPLVVEHIDDLLG